MAPTGPGQPRWATLTVQKFDLEPAQDRRVLDNVSAFDLSANGEKMLYRQGDKWFIGSVPPACPAAWRANWARWRRPRRRGRPAWAATTNAQDRRHGSLTSIRGPSGGRCTARPGGCSATSSTIPNYHGLDLAAAEKKYAEFLDGIAHRADLNYLFNEMLGQLALGHTYVGGGDTPEVKRVQGGLLGADLPHRERPLPLRPRLLRRELEPAAPRPADAARRQRQGGRVPPGRQRQGAQGDRQPLQAL